MTVRRRRTDDRLPPAEPDSLDGLRRKYLELSRKYAALVQRLESRTHRIVEDRLARHSAVHRLGFWALTATGNALALVKDGVVTTRNARWHELDARPGGWTRDTEEPSTAFIDLSQVALFEASHLPARRGAVAVRRYRTMDGSRIVEIRLERTQSRGAPAVALAQDVTEQSRTEEELTRMREALFHNEHMGILGELAASIAHELGNTLRGLTARIAALTQDPAALEPHRDLLAGIQETAESALASVRKLHDLARAGRLTPGPVDVRELLRQAVEVLHMRQEPGAPRIEVDVQLPVLPPVLGIPSEVSHLFVTLLFNARDAMPAGGKIHVRAAHVASRVRVVVSDEGAGILAEHLPQLFQPFFTTKGSAGTGLGLWLAQSTMRRLGGSISARNGAAGGAEFELELRLAGDGDHVKRGRAPPRPRERTARRG